MPRKGRAPKRPLVNDPVYGSQLVTQLVNKSCWTGRNPWPNVLCTVRSSRPVTRPAPTRSSPSSARWTTSSPPSR